MRMSWAPIRLLPLIVLALCPVTTTGTAARAATTYGCTCDVSQGFHHSSGGTATVGYLISATIAGRTLAADISVSDPQSGATTSVVGVISSDAWQGGVSDPITMTAYISTANRQRLAALTQSDLYNLRSSSTSPTTSGIGIAGPTTTHSPPRRLRCELS